MTKNEPKVVEKLWGRELWHHNGDDYCMKVLELRRGYVSSVHKHKVKSETFLATKGIVEVMRWDDEAAPLEDYSAVFLCPGESATIPAGTYHRFRAVAGPATVVEASTKHDDADVHRKVESRKGDY